MSSDPLDTEAQQQVASERAKRAALEARTEVEDLKWLMGSRRGRRIVWRLLAQAGVFQLSFNTNAMTMAFNEGRRSQGNALLALIHQHCPETYHVMQTEQTSE